jgi:uncharacterized protein YutE (UPF0331/DUF86 family)
LAHKSQIAYTQYIKNTLDRVRELKDEGHDVRECNRLLQSIVAAVIDNDYNCADFLINELEGVIQRIESLKSPAEFTPVRPGFPRLPTRFMPFAEQRGEEQFKIVVKERPQINTYEEEKSKVIIVMIYLFLFLFAVSVIALVAYIIKSSI